MSNNETTPDFGLDDFEEGGVMVMSIEEMMDMFGGELFGPPPTKEEMEKDLRAAEGDLADFGRLKTTLEELRGSEPGTEAVFHWSDEDLGTATLTVTEDGKLTSVSTETTMGGNFEDADFEAVLQDISANMSTLEESTIPTIKEMLADLEVEEE